ncbi:hypothetical protein BSKO_06611 [Bryopsis sp. KO-2023]|nr:hypothetical protein BSKO_06611 [Bryopsis sp. KO-2023]
MAGYSHEELKKFHQEVCQPRNLYVKGLLASVDDAVLKTMFQNFGEITSAKVMVNNEGKSKCFGFVCFSRAEDATRAMIEMNGLCIGNKHLYVGIAEPKSFRLAKLHYQFSSQPYVPGAPQSMSATPMPWVPYPPPMPMYHPHAMPPPFVANYQMMPPHCMASQPMMPPPFMAAHPGPLPYTPFMHGSGLPAPMSGMLPPPSPPRPAPTERNVINEQDRDQHAHEDDIQQAPNQVPMVIQDVPFASGPFPLPGSVPGPQIPLSTVPMNNPMYGVMPPCAPPPPPPMHAPLYGPIANGPIPLLPGPVPGPVPETMAMQGPPLAAHVSFQGAPCAPVVPVPAADLSIGRQGPGIPFPPMDVHCASEPLAPLPLNVALPHGYGGNGGRRGGRKTSSRRGGGRESGLRHSKIAQGALPAATVEASPHPGTGEAQNNQKEGEEEEHMALGKI